MCMHDDPHYVELVGCVALPVLSNIPTWADFSTHSSSMFTIYFEIFFLVGIGGCGNPKGLLCCLSRLILNHVII